MNFVLGTQKSFNNEYSDFALANGFGRAQFEVKRRVTQSYIGEKGDMSRTNVMARYNLNQASVCFGNGAAHHGAVFHSRPDFP